MQSQKYTQLIKDTAKKLGFQSCGISKARFLAEEEARLSQWLSQKKQGEMAYMENHFDMRLDPRKLVEGAKSVISLSYNYFTNAKQSDPNAPKISKYAYGEDYHFVVKNKLKSLLAIIQTEIGNVNARVFVDSAPIMEKAWAQQAGLGWIGKNANLINQQNGSFFFLAEIIIDIDLSYDAPVTDHCGTCTKCIDACPTEAIVAPYVVDGSKCISYFTIELKDALIPSDLQNKFEGWMFGCDTCQDVCPWNRFSKSTNEKEFTPIPEILNLSSGDWEDMTEENFKIIFKDSPLKRTKWQGIKRILKFISGE
jgi:epoxyqueuosine reductase